MIFKIKGDSIQRIPPGDHAFCVVEIFHEQVVVAIVFGPNVKTLQKKRRLGNHTSTCGQINTAAGLSSVIQCPRKYLLFCHNLRLIGNCLGNKKTNKVGQFQSLELLAKATICKLQIFIRDSYPNFSISNFKTLAI